MLTIKIIGREKLMRDLNDSLEKEAAEQERQKAAAAKERVVRSTPVDTGAARDSWQVRGNLVVSDSPYMYRLNAGSSVQAPARFIETAILEDAALKPNGQIVSQDK